MCFCLDSHSLTHKSDEVPCFRLVAVFVCVCVDAGERVWCACVCACCMGMAVCIGDIGGGDGGVSPKLLSLSLYRLARA